MASRTQLSLTPPAQLLERLEDLAERHKGDRRRRNEVAVEILERYSRHWEQAIKVYEGVIAKQYDDIGGGESGGEDNATPPPDERVPAERRGIRRKGSDRKLKAK